HHDDSVGSSAERYSGIGHRGGGRRDSAAEPGERSASWRDWYAIPESGGFCRPGGGYVRQPRRLLDLRPGYEQLGRILTEGVFHPGAFESEFPRGILRLSESPV